MKNSFTPRRYLAGASVLLLVVVVLLIGKVEHTPAAGLAPAASQQGFGGYLLTNRSGHLHAQIQDVQSTGEGVQASVCMEMPDLRPWNPYAALYVAGQVIPNSEVRLLNAKNPAVMQDTKRCYRFTFPIPAGDAPSGKATLRIEKLWLELGNGNWTPDVVATVKTRLHKVAPGVDFEVVHTAETGGGGVSIRLLSKPDTLSEEDAVALIGRLAIDELPAAWEAQIPVR